jgi:hypothetical protein
MKHILTLLAVLTLAASAVSAQDIITRRNGEDIRAIVTEVGTTNIQYKSYDNPDGPVYAIPKADVLMIRYQNGHTDSFAAAPAAGHPSTAMGIAPANPRYSDTPIVPGMSYAELKHIYNPRDYFKDYGSRYSPGWNGFGSFLIPGLGQLCCGETGRGLAFLAPNLVLVGTNLYLGRQQIKLMKKNANGDILLENGKVVYTDPQKAQSLSNISSIVTLVDLALSIWSCVDAVRVAKVKNMYYQDLRNGYSMDFSLYPSLDLAQTPSGYQPAPGLALSLRF